jgi:hypothetical protein
MSSRPALVVTIAISLILVVAVVGTVQNQKVVAQGGLIDKVQQFVNRVIEKCTHTVSTSGGGTTCNGNSGAAVQEGGGGSGVGSGCSGGGSSTGSGTGGGTGGGGGSGPVFGGSQALGSDGSSGSIKVGPNSVTQTATGGNGETISRSVSR